MKNKLAETLSLLFWGAFFQIFSFNFFDIGNVPSGRIVAAIAFILSIVALIRLIKVEKKYKAPLVLSFVNFALLIAIVILEVMRFNLLYKADAETIKTLTEQDYVKCWIWLILAIVISTVQLIYFLTLVKASISLGKKKEIPQAITTLGEKRFKTVIVTGSCGIIANLLSISTIQAVKRFLDYYNETGNIDMGSYGTISLNSLIMGIAMIAYIVGLIMLLVYLSKFKNSFQLVPAKPEGDTPQDQNQEIIDNDATIVKDDKPWDDEIK